MGAMEARLGTGFPLRETKPQNAIDLRSRDYTEKPLVQSSSPGQHGRAKGRDGKKTPVAVIDARPLTRASVSNLLKTSSRDFIILPFAGVEELLCDYQERCSAVRLFVFNLGAADITEEPIGKPIRRLIQALPNIPVVVLSDCEELPCIVGALRYGVRGYIPTSLTPPVMIGALRLVQAGGTFVPAGVLLQAFEQEAWAEHQGLKHPTPSDFEDITPRQLEVLQLVQQGKSNKVIASDLQVQESTVKVHVRQIMRKLKATNRTQVALRAQQMCGR